MKPDRRVLTLALGLLLVLAVPLRAQEDLPAAIIDVPDGHYIVCVDKSAQRLHLYNGTTRVVSFPCSTGKNPGDKRVEGDRRTPEGVYFFDRIIDGTRLPDLYGWRAYVLDYPNPVDRTRGKNGNGIWIHGRIEPLARPDTKGCVSMTNNDLKRLAPFLHSFWTPIVTLESLEQCTAAARQARAAQYQAFIDRWIQAWEKADIPTYRACYAPAFNDAASGLSLEAYIDRKAQVLGQYRHISITRGAPVIIRAAAYDLVCFFMDFAADGFQSSGIKFVYLQPDEKAAPRIINERFVLLDQAPYWQAQARGLQQRARQDLVAFIDRWIQAWEAKDIDRMQSFYARDYPDRQHYFARKASHLSPYSSIEVELSDISISRSGVFWNVQARQRFVADRYRDLGIKHLQLMHNSHGFVITGEQWERIDHES